MPNRWFERLKLLEQRLLEAASHLFDAGKDILGRINPRVGNILELNITPATSSPHVTRTKKGNKE